MLGLVLLLVIGGYVWVVWTIVGALERRWAKALVVLLAIAVPFWDLPIGFASLQIYCHEEGGVKQYRAIEPQRGLLFTESGWRAEPFRAMGMEFVEYQQFQNAPVRRVEFGPGGASKEVTSTEIRSLVRFRSTSKPLSWNIHKQEYYLESSKEGVLLASGATFYWVGGWIQRQTAPILAANIGCHQSAYQSVFDLTRPERSK